MTNTLSGTGVNEVADLAMAAADPSELELGKVYVMASRDGHDIIDLTGDEHRDQPARKKGSTTVRDVPSFAGYWGKHSRPEVSEVYADRDALKVTAVLDAHGAADTATGWAQHRLVLALKYSTAFVAWKTHNGRDMAQEEFAEFLEDNRADIFAPAAAEMLEVAQSIQAATKVDWSSGFRLADGQRRMAYTETTESRSGTKGELAIPAEIVLHLPIFDGATTADQLVARFRHRLQNGQLRLSYKLDRPDDVVTAAFEGVIAEVAEQCSATVLRGTPA